MQEDGKTFGGAEEQYRIDFGDVHTFVEDVYYAEVMYPAVTEVFGQLLPLWLWSIAGQTSGVESVPLELFGHEIRMPLVDTETQSPAGVFVGQVTVQGFYDVSGPFRQTELVGQTFGDVPLSAPE